MRMVCPNLEREDGLDTVLEVPVPELNDDESARRARTVKAWVLCGPTDHHHRREGAAPSCADVQLMLGVSGAPLVPQPVVARKAMAGQDIKDEPLEVSKAKYIVEQYVAAAGGEAALSAVASMYAMGKVRMRATTTKETKGKNKGIGGEVAGGFMIWQKRPELWSVEMVVAGSTKMSAGSDGKVAWRQTPWQPAHAYGGPPRPLRRSVQGLDPKSTADVFSGAEWVGEKTIDGDDCFVLLVDAGAGALRERSSAADVEVVRHGVRGYFSQRTGLLVRLEDTQLLRVRAAMDAADGEIAGDSLYWETFMETSIGDYRPVDGMNIAHAGRTVVSVCRFEVAAAGGEDDAGARGRSWPFMSMEETWIIEEVDFNILGLSTDFFLPPRDMLARNPRQERHKTEHLIGAGDHNSKDITAAAGDAVTTKGNGGGDGGYSVRAAAKVAKKIPVPAVASLGWFGNAKVVALEDAADEEE